MKNKILSGIFIFIMFLIYSANQISAEEIAVADSSGAIVNHDLDTKKSLKYQIKNTAIKKVLNKYNSYLIDQSEVFLDNSIYYDLDPYLLVSISGLESYFGKFLIPGTYNAFGWGSGQIYFQSWDDSISTISKALRENYYDKGAVTVDDVGRKYAESPTWSIRVKFFMSQFNQEEQKLSEIYKNI